MTDSARPAIPSDLAKFQILPGVHRKGMKALWFGGDKEGTSTALASYPSPKVVIAAGEDGISQYLNPNDELFLVRGPDSYEKALHLALKNANYFKGVVHDNFNLLYEDWLDAWEEKFGGEIKGGKWKQVKQPWRGLLREVMYSSMDVGYGVWLQDLKYVTEEVAPGVEGKLQIIAYDAPHVEKTVKRVIDMTFRCGRIYDKQGRPTAEHVVTFYGGRRPRTIPPEDLFPGKTWKFSARKPQSVWEVVMAPLKARWSEGAVDHVGLDPDLSAESHASETKEMEQAYQDQEVGRLLARIEKVKTKMEYDALGKEEIAALNALTDERKAIVLKAAEAKKKELGL